MISLKSSKEWHATMIPSYSSDSDENHFTVKAINSCILYSTYQWIRQAQSDSRTKNSNSHIGDEKTLPCLQNRKEYLMKLLTKTLLFA